MSYTPEPHFQIDYENMWNHRIQRRESKLLPYVKIEQVDGQRKRMSFREKGAMREISGRLSTTTPDSVTTYIRYLNAKKYEEVTWHDEWDDVELGKLSLPTSEDMEAHVYSYNRQADKVILDALGGNAYTGEDGTTLVALPSSQKVDENKGGANTGMNLAKISETQYILDNNDVPYEGRVFVISPQEEQDLLRDVDEVKNRDYNTQEVLATGRLSGRTWHGFHWVVTTEITERTASNLNKCYAFHKDYVCFGDGSRRASMDVLPGESHLLQIRTRARMGATRKEEKPVVEVTTYHA